MQVCCPPAAPQRPSSDVTELGVGVAATLATIEDDDDNDDDDEDTVGVADDPGREKDDVVATRLAAGASRYQLVLGSPKQSPIVTPLYPRDFNSASISWVRLVAVIS